MKTRWADTVSPETVWREYPRPSFARQGYRILNGLWKYAFTETDEMPEAYEGKILVPFSPEAALSGVKRQLKPEEFLWYRTECFLEKPEDGSRVLLHFGAVDQSCKVYVNGTYAGGHDGGYLPFTLDITELLGNGQETVLQVCVSDSSDTSYHSRGKQSLNPGGMFYTAQSGIWQTVWTETVPKQAFSYVKVTPELQQDGGTVRIRAGAAGMQETVYTAVLFTEFTDEDLQVFLKNGEIPEQRVIRRITGRIGKVLTVQMKNPELWSPEEPKLYGLFLDNGTDRVLSYFAFRECHTGTAENGIPRFFLNGKPYIQVGLLDQGYWPEGLYTAPCDEALQADILAAKDMGFNMLRKHAKLEPERWYYHCDRLGMLVWQDMVNGGSAYQSWFVTYLATVMNWLHLTVGDHHHRLLSRTEKAGREEYRRELAETVRFLYSHPSVVCYVPFNEGWGQFDAEEMVERLRRLDPTRLIDQASGWFDQGGGDVKSIHWYFLKLHFRTERRVTALTEFGGYSLRIPGHVQSEKEYGYQKFSDVKSFQNAYGKLMEQTVYPAVKNGISATVYTQLSDIEEETNGLLTYDRIPKVDPAWIRKINERLTEGNVPDM